MAGAPRKKRIVIVGGGVAGLTLAVKLAKKIDRKRVQILLVDQHASHMWKPVLHQVASGALDPFDDHLGFAGFGRVKGFSYIQGALSAVDTENNFIDVIADDRQCERTGRAAVKRRIPYDVLTIAIGSVVDDFGVSGAAEHCHMLNGERDAREFLQTLYDRKFEDETRALVDAEPIKITVVGGGSTGVELAAELNSTQRLLAEQGVGEREKPVSITLIEGEARLLSALPKAVGRDAERVLQKQGVTVVTGEQVTHVGPGSATSSTGVVYNADLTLWCAGVRGPACLKAISALDKNDQDQLMVSETLQSISSPRVFAIGDCASVVSKKGAVVDVPPRALAARQMAERATDNILAFLGDRKLKRFRYRDRGSLVSVGHLVALGVVIGRPFGIRLMVAGLFARLAYKSLYRGHILNIHGIWRGMVLILMGRMDNASKARLKLH